MASTPEVFTSISRGTPAFQLVLARVPVSQASELDSVLVKQTACLAELQSKMASLKVDVKALQEGIAMGDIATHNKMQEDLDFLINKIDDLEKRSRRREEDLDFVHFFQVMSLSIMVERISLEIQAALTIIGNSTVIITCIKRTSKLKPPELLTVNLAVTDLGMALSMYPLAIASAWNHAWIGGDISCTYYALMGFLFGVSSMMTITTMAVVRFLIAASSQINSCTFDKKKITAIIIMVWLYALLWATLPLMGWGKYGPEPFGLSCTIAWNEFSSSNNGASFIISMFILCTIIPALTIIICYSKIAWKLHKTYQSIENSNQIPNAIKMERKITTIAVLVSAGFIGCWTPYAAVSFWSMFHSSSSIPPVVTLLPCLFAKSSTAYNPLIYYKFNSTFKKEVKQLKCHCNWMVQMFNRGNTSTNRMPQGGGYGNNDDTVHGLRVNNHSTSQQTIPLSY
ncbi:opsin-5-like [Protopterus annectens]|uniref:opsin-5-like n=1 Tax=Protopterus annectens TaxID=7888 RepID=UPI001CFA8370|nr:opsin-5-like [Protopterus annectens]